MIETNASMAPSPSAGFLIICNIQQNLHPWRSRIKVFMKLHIPACSCYSQFYLYQIFINRLLVSVYRDKDVLQILSVIQTSDVSEQIRLQRIPQLNCIILQLTLSHESYLCLTRSNSADAMLRCLSKKSKSQSKGNKSLILQSSTIALLFMPPAQLSSTSPLTNPPVVDSELVQEHGIYNLSAHSFQNAIE